MHRPEPGRYDRSVHVTDSSFMNRSGGGAAGVKGPRAPSPWRCRDRAATYWDDTGPMGTALESSMRPLSRTWVLLVTLAVAGCTTGVRGSRRPRSSGSEPLACAPGAKRLPAPPAEAPVIPGIIPGTPSFRVQWEALSVEQEQYQNSRFRSSGLNIFGAPDLEVVLLNSSFQATPEQNRENRSQIAVGRLARVPDADMIALIKNLERIGFFKYAQPTESVRPYFASDRARGRITVDRDGVSMTIVSQRGLGLQDSTKAIPAIYMQAKSAIQLLKNSVPSMSVKSARVEPLHPKIPPSPGTSSAPPPPPPASGGSTSGGSGK